VAEAWRRLRDRLDLTVEVLEDGYTLEQVDAAERRVFQARDISAHGPDAVLLNLGYPHDQTRQFRGGGEATGDDLGVGPLTAESRSVLWMVRSALRRLWPEWAASGFADAFLDPYFED
jgi:hypothetical protein